MTDANKKIWKNVGITALILAAIYALISLFRGEWNFMKWFAPATPKEGDDCKTADGTDGKIDASGGCVATAGQRTSGEMSSEQITWCCNSSNPCGKSLSWFNKNCGAKRQQIQSLSILGGGGTTSNYPPCNNKVEPLKSTNAPCYLGLPS